MIEPAYRIKQGEPVYSVKQMHEQYLRGLKRALRLAVGETSKSAIRQEISKIRLAVPV